MRGINDFDRLSMFFGKAFNLIQDGWGDLEIEIIQMNDIGLEIVQNLSDFPPCFNGVHNFKRVKQPADLPGMKVDIGCIAPCTVSDNPVFVFHAEILNLIPFGRQASPDFEKIGF
jgi:hypothetical protein